MNDLVWSFAPWIVFLATTRFTNVYGGIAAGLVAGIVVLARAVSRKRVHMLDIVSTLYFLALGGLLVVVHPSNADLWGRYAQAGSHAALTAIVFGSILAGHPFTESYARESVPSQFWNTDRFHETNRRISAVWGLAFLVGTISLIVAGAVDYREALLRIVIPFGALFAAYKYTQKQQSDENEAVVVA